MVLLVRCLLLSLPVVLLSFGSGGGGAGAMGLPPPPPTVNFSVGVQGMVWCKTCRYRGYYPAMDASPLAGAVVELRCQHGRRRQSTFRGATNGGGYFQIQTSQVASFTSTDCKVYVPRSPAAGCAVQAYPAGGGRSKQGLPLKFQEFVKRSNGLQGLYSVGNFFFRPKNPSKCY